MVTQIDLNLDQGLALLDMVDVGMLVIEGDRIAFANRAFAKAVGRSLGELQATPLQDLAGDAWVDFTLGQSWADALPWPTLDGGVRWFEATQHETTKRQPNRTGRHLYRRHLPHAGGGRRSQHAPDAHRDH